MTGRCEDCKHWDTSIRSGAFLEVETGLCRASLPIPDERNGQARWAFTEDLDGCAHCSPRVNWPRNMRNWQFDEEDPRHPNYVPF
jgi:hypothetical protein